MRRTILFSLVVLVPFWFGSTGMRPLCENDCIEPTPTPNPVTQEERILEGELPLDLIPTTRCQFRLSLLSKDGLGRSSRQARNRFAGS